MLFKKITYITAAVLMGLSVLMPLVQPTALADTANLIPNASVEIADPDNSTLPDAWQQGGWGTNTSTYAYQTSGYDGTRSVQISMHDYTDGDAKWYFTPVAVEAGSQYTYSDYYTSTVATDVVAQFDDGNGNDVYQDLGAAPAANDWRQYQETFTVPAGIQHVTIFHLINSNGTLATDDFSLTAGDTITPPIQVPANLIPNASVEIADPDNSTLPDAWQQGGWGTNTPTFSYLTTGQDGTRSVRVAMTDYTDGDAKWYFTPIAVEAGSTYTFSDYYQSTIATDVVAQFDDGNGNDVYQDLGAATASTAWQQYSASFTVPAGIAHVTIFHVIAGNGTLTTDNFSLTTGGSTLPANPTSNMVPNPEVATADPTNTAIPQNWNPDSWGTNSPTFSYLNTGYDDTSSMQVSMTDYTDGDAKWWFDAQPVQPDTQYRYTEYYKATVQTEVDAVFTMSNGGTRYQIIGLPAAATDWTQFSTGFSVPLGATDVTIYHLIRANGTLTTDNFSLAPYTPVGFDRALVTLAFDDSYASTYDNGLPLLQQYGLNSTQFVITNLIGQPGYMTIPEVQALQADGQEIGSHTLTHPDLSQESASQLQDELGQSQQILENWIGAPVSDLAYPYGLYSTDTLDVAQQYYAAARGVEDGLNSKDNFDLYHLKVQNVFNTTTTAQVADWVAQAQQTNTWLILVYHSVNPSNPGNEDNVTPAQLDSELAAVKASGVTVETMQQALAELMPQL